MKGQDIKTRKPDFIKNERVNGNIKPGFNKNSSKELCEPATIRIDDKFDKKVTMNGWKVWINKQGRIIVSSATPQDETRHYRTFTYEPGTLYLKDSPDGKQHYAYFRTDTFENFLKVTGNPYITTADPSGEYQGFSGTDKDGSVYHTLLTCDGDIEKSETASGNIPVVSSKYANSFFTLSNSTIVIFDKVKINANSKTVIMHRSIITKYNIAEAIPYITDMCVYNDKRIAEWSDSVQVARDEELRVMGTSKNRRPIAEKIPAVKPVLKYTDSKTTDAIDVIPTALAESAYVMVDDPDISNAINAKIVE